VLRCRSLRKTPEENAADRIPPPEKARPVSVILGLQLGKRVKSPNSLGSQQLDIDPPKKCPIHTVWDSEKTKGHSRFPLLQIFY